MFLCISNKKRCTTHRHTHRASLVSMTSHTTTPLHHYATTPFHHYIITPFHHYITLDCSVNLPKKNIDEIGIFVLFKHLRRITTRRGGDLNHLNHLNPWTTWALDLNRHTERKRVYLISFKSHSNLWAAFIGSGQSVNCANATWTGYVSTFTIKITTTPRGSIRSTTSNASGWPIIISSQLSSIYSL